MSYFTEYLLRQIYSFQILATSLMHAMGFHQKT